MAPSLNGLPRRTSPVLRRAREVLRIESEAIQAVSKALDRRFEAAVQRIARCRGRVAVLGIGKSGLIGRKLASTLSSTGTPALFLHPAESLHGDLGMLTPSDLVLALSYSGETEEIRKILPAIKAQGLCLIALTGRESSRLGRSADLVLAVPIRREACPYNVTPTASTTAMLALGDALAMALMERRGFGKEEFARLHPGGILGKRLNLRVADLMRRGAGNPLISARATVREALAIMTRTRLGAATVIDGRGRLVGVFTDGDLRRRIPKDPGLLARRLRDVMTRSPVVAHPGQLASEAAALMSRHRVDNLPVVDPKTRRPLGILDERDLLAEGLA